MPTNRTFFIICPIGDEGSEVRQNSDDLLELIITPSLERYNFEIIRADKIPKPSTITTDIIQLVQNADLCIIDLTGSNPNVFYECGRRHETGKPFIQLIKKGDKLPFDVSSIRTIEYDISSPRSTRESTVDIQKFVEEIINQGFQAKSSGVSLSNIADTLERIERKLNNISYEKSISASTDTSDPSQKIKLQLKPVEYFLKAFETGDANGAREALLRMYELNMDPRDLVAASARLAELGDKDAYGILRQVLTNSASKLDLKTWTDFLHYIRRTFIENGTGKECFNLVNPHLQPFLKDENVSNLEKAILINDISLLQSSFGDHESALENAKKVIQLDSGNLIYYFNLALIYQDLNLMDKCVEQLDIYTSKEESIKLPSYILSYAVGIYFQRKREQDAKRVFNILKKADPAEARKTLNAHEGLQNIL
jgi:tetratricopeptide (TPR) repeat protein